MKIAFLHPFQLRYRRGIERFVWELAKSFATRDDIEVDILTWEQPKPLDWGEIPKNMRVFAVPYSRYYAKYVAIPFYLKWLVGNRYDWVILSFAGYGEAETIALLRRIRSQKYSIVFNYPLNQVPDRYEEFKKYDLVISANYLVSVSHYVAEGVKTSFGVDSSVIENGVDPDIFKPALQDRRRVREEIGVSQTAPVLISIAALEIRKGIQYVIRALCYLVENFSDIEYWVIGEGSEREALEKEAYQNGVEQHVRFLGPQENVPAYLAAADVGCLLSQGEAFPIATLEYMAMGLPLVTSKSEPFPEIVNPTWGVMVDEQQTQQVADVIRELLNDETRRHKMGVAGRDQVLRHYTWDVIAEKYLALLKSVT